MASRIHWICSTRSWRGSEASTRSLKPARRRPPLSSLAQPGPEKPAKQQPPFPVADHPPQKIEISAVVGFEPFQQRPREMQYRRQKSPARQPFQDRAIHVGHVLLEHMIEVANWLMEMEAKNETDGRHDYPTTRERDPPRAAAIAGITLGNT